MRIVAIETSTRTGSVAILERDVLVREAELPSERRTAQALAPALEQLLSQANWEPQSVGLVAVTHGPGSFTGLRIAVTTAKVFAYAVAAELVSVNTLAVLAEQLPTEAVDACLLISAQRGQVFAGRYQRDQQAQWAVKTPCQIMQPNAVRESLEPGMWISGPAATQLDVNSMASIALAPETARIPRARTVGRVGWQAYLRGETVDPFALKPEYYRPSYAEEKRP